MERYSHELYRSQFEGQMQQAGAIGASERHNKKNTNGRIETNEGFVIR
jgi:hypothetical protein